jgi:tetratricopeptide (TPR) repeat protein
MRKNFGEYVYWTREMLVFVISAVRGKAETIERYHRTADGIAEAFSLYYEKSVGDEIRRLYYEQSLIFTEIARAYTYENAKLYSEALERLTRSIAVITEYFQKINAAYDTKKVSEFMENNADRAVSQIKLRFAGNFDEEIDAFDNAFDNILEMADYVCATIKNTMF